MQYAENTVAFAGVCPAAKKDFWQNVESDQGLEAKPTANFRLGVDQHSRIEQALRIQGCLGRPEGSGEQRRALAIVPPPVVAPDRMMVGDRAAICDHGIKTSRLDGVPLRAQLAMPPDGVEGKVRRRPVRIYMGAAAGYPAGTPGCLDDGVLGSGFDPVVE